MDDSILVLNAGSSSLKFAVYRIAGDLVLRGQFEGLGLAPHVLIRNPNNATLCEGRWQDSFCGRLILKVIALGKCPTWSALVLGGAP